MCGVHEQSATNTRPPANVSAPPTTPPAPLKSLFISTITKRLRNNSSDDLIIHLTTHILLLLLAVPFLAVLFTFYPNTKAMTASTIEIFTFCEAYVKTAIGWLEGHPIGLKLNTVLSKNINNDLLVIVSSLGDYTHSILRCV